MNEEISEHDIDLEGFSTIRINKIKTDNYTAIYKAIAEITLPISAMDVRKVQGIVGDIYSGGGIKVSITEDLDSLNNSDKILVIGSSKTIQYRYESSSELMTKYFKIIDESNSQILSLIDQYNITEKQFFPIFGFGEINKGIKVFEQLKQQQLNKLEQIKNAISNKCKSELKTIEEINSSMEITKSNKVNAILWGILEENISLDLVEEYLREYPRKATTDYRRLLCAYDYVKYGKCD